MKFKIIVEKEIDNEGYHAYCPSLKGCHSCGATKREAIKNIKEAIELYLEPEPKLIKRELAKEHLFHPQLLEIAILCKSFPALQPKKLSELSSHQKPLRQLSKTLVLPLKNL